MSRSLALAILLLVNNPHLAAGIPVRDCEMRVRGGRANVADGRNLLAGGGFERAEGKRPAGWDWVDGFGRTSTLDREVKHGGESSLRMEDFKADNPHGNCRVSVKLELKPWQQYQLSFWARTEDVRGGEIKCMALAGGKALSHTNTGIRRTQDWNRHELLFNSFEHGEVQLYIGIWSGGSGTMWIDDAELRQVAGVNMLRRDGCPLRVTSADGGTVYEEGRGSRSGPRPRRGSRAWTAGCTPPGARITRSSRILPVW